MTIRYLLTLYISTFSLLCLAQNEPWSPRIANYDMELTFDPEQKNISCKELLTWNNPSTDTIYELQFHIYQNAFKNTRSTFMKERGFFSDMLSETATNCGWSWVDIQSISDEHGHDLKQTMEYIQTDDDNNTDQTVLSLTLPTPIMPGGSIKVNLNWKSKIPLTMPRTGYNKDYFFMAQWFPKVGVYEPAGTRYATKGQWNCHQYHSRGEYYSDFGLYNVKITAPSNYVLGASGVLVEETETGDQKVWHFQAADVIDFTWTASPHFVIVEEQWKDVTIKTMVYPERVHCVDRYITAMKNALEYFDEHLAKYPYPIITVIDPPIHGIFSSGMEYPTLITGLSSCLLPVGVRTIETLAVHEFTHQFFMQMVASHEVEEPFLDEGFTTYYEGRILDHYYGSKTSTIDVLGVTVGNIELNRADYFGMPNPKIAENARRSWQYKDGGYGEISYNKTAIWLRTLEGIVGIETMDEIMQIYFQNWKFKHPCATDFIDVANEVVRKKHGTAFGEDLQWFFDQVIYETVICDYSIASIQNNPTYEEAGYIDDFENCTLPEELEGDQFKAKATVHRLGEMQLPVEVLIHFDDESSVLEKWDGLDRSISFEYISKKKIVSAEVDPERKIYIDKNFINNSMSTQKQQKGIRKYMAQFMTWVQHAMLGVGLFT